MKDYNKNKESSHFKYWDVNNVYGWAMRQKLPVNDSKQVKNISELEKSFIKSYTEESDEGYLLEVDIQFLENLHNLPVDLLFLSDRMEIEKVEKLIPNLHNRTEYVICIKNLKQALNHGLVLKKVRRIIKFNQKAWLKSYIDMNTGLWKKGENDFFKLINNSDFGRSMVNARRHRDIELVTAERRRNYLVPEANYHTTKFF